MSPFDRPIRRVGFVMIALFIVLAAQLTYIQVNRAEELKSDPRNVRVILRDLKQPRGRILTADGFEVARSIAVDDQYGFLRQYPLGSLFGHVSGYQSVLFGTSGVERSYDDELLGNDLEIQTSDLSDLLTGKDQLGNVVLTLRKDVQEAARAALGGRSGSIVVLDTQTGAVVASYSEPTYDPTVLAGHRSKEVQAAYDALNADPRNPALPKAYRQIYPPGSTFKIITTAIGLEAGATSLEQIYPELNELDLPLTDRTLANFGGNRCGGNLVDSFVKSCNTVFGQIGLDLGEDFAAGMEQFGINDGSPGLDIVPGAVGSIGPKRGTFEQEQPTFALAGIGQGPVSVSPLQMALVAQAVANGGEMMQPHVMAEIRNKADERVRAFRPRVLHQSMRPDTAAALTAMMRQVVERGTGSLAQIPGVAVAGKTGTAQVRDGVDPHAWFVGFAPADAPRYAIAVIVENGGDLGSEATGGRVAAPMAAIVLSSALQGNG